MLKSCSYCGGIHKRGQTCPRKPKRTKESNHINKFRWSRQWTNKRNEINKRDNYLCQICIRNLYHTYTQYNYTNIEVHHIVPIVEDWNKRLDNYNLICLCSYHHKMAEKGQIGRDELIQIVVEQESRMTI